SPSCRGQHVSPIRFGASTSNEEWLPSQTLHDPERVDGEQPVLLWIPPRDFGDHRTPPQAGAERRYRLLLWQDERVSREPIGNHQRVNAEALHEMLHITAYCRDNGSRGEPTPINPLKGDGTVGIPQESDLRPDLRLPQEPVQVEHRMDRVPLLRQDHRVASVSQMGQEHLPQQKRRQRGRVVRLFALFTIVDSPGVIATDPLTPAIQPEVVV